MPSLGMVTINALSASDSVIIPVQAQYLPAKGMTQLVQTISRVKKRINPNLKIDGMLLTLVDSRTNLAKSTVEALRENFGSQIKMYRTYIPIAVKAAETSSKGKSIFAYEPGQHGVKGVHRIYKGGVSRWQEERATSLSRSSMTYSQRRNREMKKKLSKIRDIPLTEIDDFPDHPFKVRDDEDMAQLIESIKERGGNHTGDGKAERGRQIRTHIGTQTKASL